MVASQEHNVEELGVYVLGLLDDDRSQVVEEHLIACAGCRAVVDELLGVQELLAFAPASAFADPAPSPRAVVTPKGRGGGKPPVRPRQWAMAAAAATVVGLAVGGGFVIGRSTADDGLAAPPSPRTPDTQAPPVPGVRFASGTGAGHARLTVRLEPALGWVRINASVAGIPEGRRCRLVVVARDGARQVAASWLAPAKGEGTGTNLDGAVLVAPGDVVRVLVESLDGEEFVAATV